VPRSTSPTGSQHMQVWHGSGCGAALQWQRRGNLQTRAAAALLHSCSSLLGCHPAAVSASCRMPTSGSCLGNCLRKRHRVLCLQGLGSGCTSIEAAMLRSSGSRSVCCRRDSSSRSAASCRAKSAFLSSVWMNARWRRHTCDKTPALSAQCWHLTHSALLRPLHADYTTKSAGSYGLIMQH
jgi:hypothetical protein